MMRALQVVAALLLGACLITNIIAIQETLAFRIPGDRIVGSRKLTPVRRAALYGEDAGQMIADLERAVLKARAEGHERIVISYTGKFSNVLLSTATHAGWPMQVIEQATPGMKRAERLSKAAKREASLFISLRPGQGWTAVELDPSMIHSKAEKED